METPSETTPDPTPAQVLAQMVELDAEHAEIRQRFALEWGKEEMEDYSKWTPAQKEAWRDFIQRREPVRLLWDTAATRQEMHLLIRAQAAALAEREAEVERLRAR